MRRPDDWLAGSKHRDLRACVGAKLALATRLGNRVRGAPPSPPDMSASRPRARSPCAVCVCVSALQGVVWACGPITRAQRAGGLVSGLSFFSLPGRGLRIR